MSSRQNEIESNLLEVKERVEIAAKLVNRDAKEINLIVVTKNFPISDVEILKKLGQQNFGENRDQEAAPKAAQVAGTWHFQGQIQSNKIKSIAQWASVIHSISGEKEILKFSQSSRGHQIFLQVSLADSDQQLGRGGALARELPALAELVNQSNNLELMGLMAVGPIGVEPDKAFAKLAQIHAEFLCDFPTAKYLSAGMSGDFESAIKYGATHIRVGSSILGSRSPH